MKKLLRGLAVASVLFLSVSTAILADTWSYYITIVVKDTSGVARTNVPVLTGISGSGFYSLGYIDSDGLDTRLFEWTGTSDVAGQMLALSEYGFIIPSLGANQQRTYRLYLNYAPDRAGWGVVAGDGGYVTTADAAALEPGNNFEISVLSGVDTTVGYVGEPVFYKAATLDCIVSAASELTANIYGAVGTITEQAADNSLTKAYTNVWVGQTYTAATAMWISSISIYGEEEGTAAGNAVVSIMATSAGNIINTVLGTATARPATDFPAEGAPAYVAFTFASPVFVYAGQVIGIALQVTGGDSSNDIHWMHQTTDVLAGGNRFTGAGATPTWTSTTGDCHVKITGAIPAKSVTATGITTGEHTIKVSADTSNLYIYDGVTLKDTEALGGASVQNTAYDWKWIDSDCSPYVNQISMTIGGTLIAHYHPVTMIDGTVLPDLEGAAQNGVITYGANSNLTVTIGGLVSYSSTESDIGSSGGVADTVPDAPIPDNWYAAGTGVGLPFYSTFNAAATSIGWTTQTLYLYIILGLAVVIGLGVLLFTGSTLMAILGCGIMMGFGVNMEIVSGWMMLVYISMAVGILYLARKA